MDLKTLRKQQNKRKFRYGYMWAILMAILWGFWYLAGSVIWAVDPFYTMYEDIVAMSGDTSALLLTAVLIAAAASLGASFAVAILWCGVQGKYGEIVRTAKAFHPCSKWFLLASIFGGLMAYTGSYMAIGFVGPSFAAVATLLYPVFGSILAWKWYGEKLTKRVVIGIAVIIFGGATLFWGNIVAEMTSGNVNWLGYLGGLMAPIGWGIEGAIAGKGLDLTESDAGLSLRFISEAGIWWILVLPILTIAGFPVIEYATQLFNPLTLFLIFALGFGAAICYVCWYRSFALIGVARGQGIGNIMAIFVILFVFLFLGQTPGLAIAVGAIICLTGSFIMFSENNEDMESVRGE